MPYEITLPEYVIVNDVPLATPAWLFPSFTELWGDPDYRGTDRTVPLRPGKLAYPRRDDSAVYSLEGFVFADADWEGDPYPAGRAGLEENLDHLLTNVSAPVETGDGTVEMILVKPGSTVSADVHAGPLKVQGNGPTAIRATLRIEVPSGRFDTPASV